MRMLRNAMICLKSVMRVRPAVAWSTVCPASRMSSRYFADSSCIQQPAALVHGFEEIAVRRSAGLHQIDRACKQGLERFLEAEILLQRLDMPCAVELHQKIEVAAGRVECARRRGAEQLQPAHAEARADLGDLGAVRFNQSRQR